MAQRYEVSFDAAKLQALTAKQQMREQRRDRILNTYTRNALDTEFLDAQTKQRQLYAALERYKQLEEDERQLKLNKYVEAQEKELLRAKQLREREDLQFSLYCLNKENTREWDINDPAALARQQKTRIDSIDENGNVIVDKKLGVSSGYFFAGEDLKYQERLRLYKEQFDAEIYREMATKEAKRIEEARQQKAEHEYELKINAFVAANEKLQQQRRKEIQATLDRENMELSQRKQFERTQRIKEEDNEARRAADYFQSTRMMKEVARPGIVDEFKGFDKQQADYFNRELEIQLAEVQRRRAETNAEHIRQGEVELQQIKARELMEFEDAKKKQYLQRQLAEQNRIMAAQQNYAKLQSIKDLGRNEITEDFFAGFGKSER